MLDSRRGNRESVENEQQNKREIPGVQGVDGSGEHGREDSCDGQGFSRDGSNYEDGGRADRKDEVHGEIRDNSLACSPG